MIAAKQIFCLNEQGKRRNNEDRIYPPKGHATTSDKLFVVCDGVGGESKGEVASEIVSSSVYQYISHQDLPLPDGQEAVEKAILFANHQLAEYIVTDVSATRMSTTLTLILMKQQSVTAAWCGDTRIHHIRDGRVLWKSDDHSMVHELVKSGEISEEEARTHPRKNIITRSLNALNSNNKVDFHEITDCRTDDFFLLCTDGFLEQVDEKAIYEVLNNDAETDKAESFLKICEGRTKDNFSMYLVKVADGDVAVKDTSTINNSTGNVFAKKTISVLVEDELKPNEKVTTAAVASPAKKRWWPIVLVVIIVIACVVAWLLLRKKNESISKSTVNTSVLAFRNSNIILTNQSALHSQNFAS